MSLCDICEDFSVLYGNLSKNVSEFECLLNKLLLLALRKNDEKVC